MLFSHFLLVLTQNLHTRVSNFWNSFHTRSDFGNFLPARTRVVGRHFYCLDWFGFKVKLWVLSSSKITSLNIWNEHNFAEKKSLSLQKSENWINEKFWMNRLCSNAQLIFTTATIDLFSFKEALLSLRSFPLPSFNHSRKKRQRNP